MAIQHSSPLTRGQLEVVYDTAQKLDSLRVTDRYVERLGSMPLSSILGLQWRPGRLGRWRQQRVRNNTHLPLVFGIRRVEGDSPTEEDLVLQLACRDTTSGKIIPQTLLTVYDFQPHPNGDGLTSTPDWLQRDEMLDAIDLFRKQADVGLTVEPPAELLAYQQMLKAFDAELRDEWIQKYGPFSNDA